MAFGIVMAGTSYAVPALSSDILALLLIPVLRWVRHSAALVAASR